MERELVKVPEAATRLSIGRSKAYAMARDGTMPGLVRVGGMVRVSVRALDRFIEDQTAPKSAA